MHEARLRDLLHLTLTPGLGPVLIARAVQAFGSPGAVLHAGHHRLAAIRGIGPASARDICAAFPAAAALVDEELAIARDLGVALLTSDHPSYPPLLAQIDDPPPILYMRGSLDPAERDRYPVAIVGSRRCTLYGLEQAQRFGAALAGYGLTVVSGGARGIDTAAHRGALQAGGRTVAVVGCGLACCYPEGNEELFGAIIAGDGGHGAVVSELPLRTPPSPRNFPARNRIISGCALGVVVIEAGAGSGALITARLAGEDHGREVLVVPGRVDSPASAGSLSLLKAGGAALVTAPTDVVDALECSARHLHAGTHAARFGSPAAPVPEGDAPSTGPSTPGWLLETTLSAPQRAVLEALDEPASLDELTGRVGGNAGEVLAAVTVLELRRLVERRAGRLVRVKGP